MFDPGELCNKLQGLYEIFYGMKHTQVGVGKGKYVPCAIKVSNVYR